MITELQKKTAQAIVRIFETSKPQGDYGAVTVIPGDNGHLSYGCSQASLTSGNLGLLVEAYIIAGGKYSDNLKPYLSALKRKDTSLDNNFSLKSALTAAGNDPIMRRVLDDFFDRFFWVPAVRIAEAMEIRSALGTLVIYDSKLQGSLDLIAGRTNQKHGSPLMIGERDWIDRYIDERREWLRNHSNALLRNTVYRANALTTLVVMGRWNLDLPLHVRGIEITENILAGGAVRRTLKLASPPMSGDDIKELQGLLNRFWKGQDAVRAGILKLTEDGVFGQRTDDALRAFQGANNLKPDGVAGKLTWAALDRT